MGTIFTYDFQSLFQVQGDPASVFVYNMGFTVLLYPLKAGL